MIHDKSTTRNRAWRRLSFACFLAWGLPAWSQGPPATDIFLADLQIESGRLQVAEPVNVTNRAGYDNQPAFLPDGTALLYTSIREDGQADTYRYHLTDSTITRVTRTRESEYSPTPLCDGRHFSVVRVELDSTQRLWQFPLGGGAPSLLLSDVQPVGYHAWGTPDLVALFVLGNPNSLQIADLRTGQSRRVAERVGRSLHKIPGEAAFSFVHKVAEDTWWLKRVTFETHAITSLIRTLPGREDYAWMPDGVVLMARDVTLYKWQPEVDEDWVVVADLAGYGLKGITRLAVSPKGDKLALVSAR